MQTLRTRHVVLSLCFLALCARGETLTPVGVVASSEYTGAGDRKAIHLIDGSGLAGGAHTAQEANATMWMASNASGQSVRFNFGGVYPVATVKIWNFNWALISNGNSCLLRGVKSYDLLVSTQVADPGTAFGDAAKWTVVAAGLTLPRASGLDSYAGEEPVNLGGVDAHWLAIRINNTQGDLNYVGLSEVRFTTSQQLALTSAEMPEGAAGTTNNMAFALSVAKPTVAAISVDYATADATAVAGVDYIARSGVATIAAGAMSTVIEVSVIGNDLGEADKTFELRLLEVVTQNAQLPDAPAVGTILNDDDIAPRIELARVLPISRDGARARAIITAAYPLPESITFVLDTTDRGDNVEAWAQRQTIAAPATHEWLETNFTGLVAGETYTLRAMASNACGTAWALPQTFVFLPFEALLEAEAFETSGGWALDTQFFSTMGSSYLLAHGMGTPVEDAVTTLRLAHVPLECRVWVRTRDWIPNHTEAPGLFEVLVDDVALPKILGVEPPNWGWVDGGVMTLTNVNTRIALHDLTGYEGRCDALFLTANLDAPAPPNDLDALNAWRRAQLGIEPETLPAFDTVVVGGGLAGCAAALAAARSGATVALVQDRPVLGGNASGEIRVRPEGVIPGNNVGTIVNAIGGNGFSNSEPGAALYDVKRFNTLSAEPNVTLFLNYRAIGVATNANAIQSVTIQHTQTNQEKILCGTTYIDCTGDAWLGFWAGAQCRMGREAKSEHNESYAPATADSVTLGTSLMWRTTTSATLVTLPPLAWATAVAGGTAETSGNWNWETGFDKDTIYDAEAIRDHMFRAIYGSFWNAKQNAKNANLSLAWIGYVGGKRESRRLIGDHIITQNDIVNTTYFHDAVAKVSWPIDLHYANGSFRSTAQQFSVAQWWIPFRSLYSVNISNLMMAGRNLSATHVGLGSPRVMHTTAQMGAACGFAASLCAQYAATPRDIYTAHLDELQALIGATQLPPVPVAPPAAPPQIILDNTSAVCTGSWPASTYDADYYGTNYQHDDNKDKGAKSARYQTLLPRAGHWTVFGYWPKSDTRSSYVPADITHAGGSDTVKFSQRSTGGAWRELGTYVFTTNAPASILLRTTDATDGHVIADAFGFTQNYDSTGNGLPDWWQTLHGYTPGEMSPLADDDGDGMSNIAEYIAGTDPADPDSRFVIHDFLNSFAPSAFTFTWASEAGRRYTILATGDLREPFVPLFTGIAATPPENPTYIPSDATSQLVTLCAELD